MPKWLKKPTLRGARRFLSSRAFSYISILSVMGLLAMWVIPFQIYGVPAWRVQNIANKVWFFRISYALVYMSLFFCILQLTAALLKNSRRQENVVYSSGELAKYANYFSTPASEMDMGKMVKVLQKQGYKVNSSENAIYAAKGSRWGTVLFHASTFLIVIGVFVSLNTSFYGELIATEGQLFSSQGDLYTSPTPEEVDKLRGRIPDFSFKLERVNPQFWQDKLLFTNLEADVAYPANTLENYATIKLNSPLYSRSTFLELAGFGYSPYFILRDKGGKVLDQAYVNLAVFPSGSEDYFQVPGLPYEIHVLLWSDYSLENNEPHTKSYNLVNPLYTVYILKDKNPGQNVEQSSPENKQLVIQGNFRPGQEINFEGYTLTFPDIRYYGQFRLIHDPGVWPVFTGFSLMILGLIWRFLFYRRRIWAVLEGTGGTLHMAGNSDYYRESFALELDTLREKVLGKGRG